MPVQVRISQRARRMALRIPPAGTVVELVLPATAPLAGGLRFLDLKRDWLARQLAGMPPRIAFVDGAAIPILGVPHRLRAVTAQRGVTPIFRIGDGAIEVAGRVETSGQADLARRTRSGLALHAREVLAAKTKTLARSTGRPAGRVSVGDPQLRWGSCAASGNIKYSWRLILAPEPVLDYVVAHEVAHLIEMNHGAAFWRLVEDLAPGHGTSRAWLKRHGGALLRYG
ncbi:MAG TPA: SprT family zinc-dependent metalloprotease [Stellaceae bacterium]|nr:SprT family zinc-dependent metalloprotease [Stellaceae bacterium]